MQSLAMNQNIPLTIVTLKSSAVLLDLIEAIIRRENTGLAGMNSSKLAMTYPSDVEATELPSYARAALVRKLDARRAPEADRVCCTAPDAKEE